MRDCVSPNLSSAVIETLQAVDQQAINLKSFCQFSAMQSRCRGLAVLYSISFNFGEFFTNPETEYESRPFGTFGPMKFSGKLHPPPPVKIL